MARFGVEKARLIAAGTPVEDADVLIAATALVCGGRIATGNVRHFSRFENLEVMAW
jgi:predicted nucleic acid-binding protein